MSPRRWGGTPIHNLILAPGQAHRITAAEHLGVVHEQGATLSAGGGAPLLGASLRYVGPKGTACTTARSLSIAST